MFRLDPESAKDAVYGGQFFGGGGGGQLEDGLRVAREALACGEITVLDVGELSPEDTVVTASLVGSPTDGAAGVTPAHCARVYELFRRHFSAPIAALMANEAGGQSITNGWLTAAAAGIPMLDAACNGRAHPTGVMGSMLLDRIEGYRTVQTAAGGLGEHDLEICACGSVESTSRLVRETAAQARSFVTVLRNPATAAHVRAHGAPGALRECIRIGRLFRAHENDPVALASSLERALGCRIAARGVVDDCSLTAKGGFDVGRAVIRSGGGDLEVTFWNEYMTAELGGRRLATFPDLIALLDASTGLPITSARLCRGTEVLAAVVPRERLLLSSTMSDRALLSPCEAAVGKAIPEPQGAS